MRFIIDLKGANDLLELYIGSKFQVAIYSESLRKIAIRLWFPNVDEVLYLIGVGCISFNGNFDIANSNLSITQERGVYESVTKIKDSISGFELITSGGFSLVQGIESDFGRSFDGFLKQQE